MSTKSAYFALTKDNLTSFVPHIKECDSTYPHSGLSKGTYPTNKHNRFKEITD